MTGTQFLSERLDIACNIWRYIYRREIIIENNIWCFVGDYYDDTPWLPLVLMKAERMNICDKVVYNYLERSDSLVNAQSPKAVQRKIDGGFMLLDLLKGQLNTIDDLAVRKWYDMMIAHSVLSLLTLIGIHQFSMRKTYLTRLKSINIFPLSAYKLENKSTRKVRVINFSPYLFMKLINLKHSR